VLYSSGLEKLPQQWAHLKSLLPNRGLVHDVASFGVGESVLSRAPRRSFHAQGHQPHFLFGLHRSFELEQAPLRLENVLRKHKHDALAGAHNAWQVMQLSSIFPIQKNLQRYKVNLN
jgi:hypothetical protein